MGKERFDGWDDCGPYFEALRPGPGRRHVHPAVSLLKVQDDLGMVFLDPDCKDRTEAMLRRVPDSAACASSARASSYAQLFILDGMVALIVLTVHFGAVPVGGADVPADTPTLVVPVVMQPEHGQELREWCGELWHIGVAYEGGGGLFGVSARLECTKQDLRRAYRHSRNAVRRGRRGCAGPVGLVAVGEPLLRGPTAEDVVDMLLADAATGLAYARMAMRTSAAGPMVDALLDAVGDDLLAAAVLDDPAGGAGLLSRRVGDVGRVLDVLAAHQVSTRRRNRASLPFHPAALEAVVSDRGVSRFAAEVVAAGRNDIGLRDTLRHARDKALYFRFQAAVHPDPAARIEVLTDEVGQQGIINAVRRGEADADLVEVLCCPAGRQDAGEALTSTVNALDVDTNEAATLLLEWGWELEPVAAAVARGGRWGRLWDWLSGLVEGDRLVETATVCGMAAGDLLRAVDRQPAAAVDRLGAIGVSRPVIDRLVAEAGVDLTVTASRPPSHRELVGDTTPDCDRNVPTVPGGHEADVSSAVPADPLPVPDDVAAAVAIAEDRCAHLVFLPEAHKSAVESLYPDPGRVLADLVALDRLAGAWAAGTLGCAPRMAAARYGLTGYRSGLSQTAVTTYAADYTRTYEAREIMMGPHLSRGVGPANQVMRIYWWADDDTGVFVIGHVGAHLRDAGYST